MTVVRTDTDDVPASLAPSPGEKAALGALISDVTRDLKTLMRQEVELAKAEITAETAKLGKGAGMLGGAGFAAVMVAVFLSTALWWALANVMDQSWAALIVAALWAVIGAVLFVVGRASLRSFSLKPERTLNSIKQLPAAFTGR